MSAPRSGKDVRKGVAIRLEPYEKELLKKEYGGVQAAVDYLVKGLKKKMFFKDWVLQFKGENSAFGDFATDAASDQRFPSSNNKKEILEHLARMNACREAVEAFEEIWEVFKKK